ncbi:MAG: hypothetical protein M3R17_12790 [Bacteroidota bacterium]|nr:hypothetical protein [Bacteroidota bacterium]
MKFSKLCFILLLFSATFLQAQVVLPYSINKEGLPSDTARLAVSHTNDGLKPGSFALIGIQEKDVAPDFVLYDTAGVPCQLSKLLAEGKPVLLVAVSYTCPQSRQGIGTRLRELSQRFGNVINIRLIYIIEAHPASPDVCPYTGVAYTTEANVRDSVLFRQPKTYLERKEIAKELIRDLNVSVPVLIDSPDNSWWLNFGPAPNNAYLITPSGMVYKKYAWLANPNFGTDITILRRDETAMKTDFSKKVYIEKGQELNGRSTLYVNGQHYSLDIFNASGKILHHKDNVDAAQLDLDKIRLPKGEYRIVVKTIEGYSYCLPYSRE